MSEILQIRIIKKHWILKLQISDCHQDLLPLWSIDQVVRVLDSQSRGPRLKITGLLSLSSFWDQSNEHQDPLGTFLNSCLAALQPPLGHSQGDSLTNPMLITVFWVPKLGQAPSGVWAENLPTLIRTPYPTRPHSPQKVKGNTVKSKLFPCSGFAALKQLTPSTKKRPKNVVKTQI